MKIDYTRQKNLAFSAARLNILSLADSHGNILSIPDVIKAVQMNSEDIFVKANEKSTMNILSIAGDYFMNPHKKGFLTHPEMSNGDMQYSFLLKLIHTIKSQFSGHADNFDTTFTIGNHDIEGGDEWLFEKLAKAPMTSILTNVYYNRSGLALKLRGDKVVQSKVYEIPDSKNPKLKNHALFLGVTIPSMNYYVPEKLKFTRFYNNSNKNDVALEEKDLRKTIRVIRHQVQQFKKKYENGAVIVMAHTGNKISKMLAEKIPDINLILNGHDHKEFMTFINKTLVLSHGQNNKFFRNIQLLFNDEGKLTELKEHRYDTEPYNKMARNDEIIQKFVKNRLQKDLVPLVEFKDNAGEPEEMVLDDSIRYANNTLANYITSALKRAVKRDYPELDAVGISTSIFRSGLKSNTRRSTFNNIDLMKMFDGANEKLLEIKKGTVTGDELVKLIVENVKNNLKSKTRNALLQWSDIQINKTLINEILNGHSKAKYIDAIKVRKKETKQFEPVDPKKLYTIMLSDKYLLKDTKNIKVPAKIRDRFEPIGETYESLFKKYLALINYDVKITDKTREKRIL